MAIDIRRGFKRIYLIWLAIFLLLALWNHNYVTYVPVENDREPNITTWEDDKGETHNYYPFACLNWEKSFGEKLEITEYHKKKYGENVQLGFKDWYGRVGEDTLSENELSRCHYITTGLLGTGDKLTKAFIFYALLPIPIYFFIIFIINGFRKKDK